MPTAPNSLTNTALPARVPGQSGICVKRVVLPAPGNPAQSVRSCKEQFSCRHPLKFELVRSRE